MKYGLALELKDEGFPQEIKEGSFYWTGMMKRPFCWGGEGEDKPYGEYVLHPTLEELIEACGDKFDSLNVVRQDGQILWFATFEPTGYDGLTPTEAVARLWLALNKSEVGITSKEIKL